MKIETKYDIGDIVYGLEPCAEDLHVQRFQITDISFRDGFVRYGVRFTTNYCRTSTDVMFEENLFETVDECIKYLIKKENTRHEQYLKEIEEIGKKYEKGK